VASLGLKRTISLALYYGLARRLPRSSNRLSKKIRASLCRNIFLSAASDINIETGAFFGSGRDIQIGDKSGIGLNASLSGPITIGSNVMMGPDVMIYTQNHETARTDIPMIEQGNTSPKPVIIEDDVWIGARSIILPGVTLKKGTIVAAGSIVTKNTESYDIVGGNPARFIKSRLKKED